MGDWNFLGGILEEVHIHSTMVGKIWLTILFVFRMLVLGVAAEDVWNDEQSDFVCNTEQPGCRNVCYDRAFPISLIRYWVLQVILVSSPSLVYMGHALYRLRTLEKERQRRKAALRQELEVAGAETAEQQRRQLEREMRQLDQRRVNKAPLRGSLLRTYIAHIMVRATFEVGFMVGQYLLYGLCLSALFKCEHEPCPNVVDCFVSRPTEKSVFMVFMQCIAGVSLILSLLEVMHLGFKALKKGVLDYCPQLKDELDDCSFGQHKKNSVVPQPREGSATGHKVGVPTASTEGHLYPTLNRSSSTFTTIQSGPPKDAVGVKEAKEEPPTLAEHIGTSNTTSSDNRSPPTESVTSPQQKGLQLEPTDPIYPTLPGDAYHTSSCPTLLAGFGRKPRRVSVPWHCFTVEETNGSINNDCHGERGGDKAHFPGGRAHTASRSDFSRMSRAETSDSEGGSSSESRQSGAIMPTVLPIRRMSLASVSHSRRAPNDLKI